MHETFIPEISQFIENAVSDNLNSDELNLCDNVIDEDGSVFNESVANESVANECVENNLSCKELNAEKFSEENTITNEVTQKPRGRNRRKNTGNNSIIRISQFRC